jgi:hypothetical protein
MKKEAKDLWVKALRSKEFQQGRNGLYRDNKMCVLGVLCMLAMINGVCDFEEFKSGTFKGMAAFDGKAGVLPQSVVEWAEMLSNNGSIKGEFVTLSGMNDFGLYDFDQLADIIDKHWENM